MNVVDSVKLSEAPRSRWLILPSLRGRQIQLDVIRCLAILLAMGWHFNRSLTGVRVVDWVAEPGRRFGWAGVDLFFVLSGLLIGGLIFNEYKREKKFSPKRFLIRRIFKIWPVMYALLAIQTLIGHHLWQTYLFQCFFHVQNYVPNSMDHLWSLAVEEHFYLLFAFGFSFMLRAWGSADRLPTILVLIMIFAFAARLAGVEFGVSPLALQTQTQFRIDGLASGVLLAWIKSFRTDIFNNLLGRKLLLACLVVIDVIVLSVVDSKNPIMQTMGYTLNYIGASALILLIYDVEWLGRSRVAAVLAWIGLFSYAMYVFQFVALKPAIGLAAKLHLASQKAALFQLCAAYVGAIATAAIITILIERPMLALRDRLFPGLVAVPVIEASAG